MTDADGYVTEIAYTHGFHAQMAPGPVALALAARGVAPPDFSRPFTWCELGFGQGVNLALLAACFPQGRFFGNDILPAHVDGARRMAAAAGAGNLSVSTEGFADYLHADLPPMDVIALHGVWSWVGAGNRAHIVEFIRRHLKPGGIVHVSYNALPGWSHHLPLRHLMKAHLDGDSGALADRIGRAVAFAGRVARLGGGYFAATPSALARLEDLAERPAGYLAHEYFNRHWDPLHFGEVAGELAAAGLSFAAPALPSDLLDARALSGRAREMLAGIADPLLRETVRDFLTNQPFRRDLFVRDEAGGAGGAAPVPVPHPALHTLPFAATGASARVPGVARLPQGEVVLDRALCVEILDRLAAGCAAADTLAGTLGVEVGRAADALLLLAALGLVAPAAGMGQGAGTAAAFTRRVLELAAEGDTIAALASPVLGSGVETDRVERLFLLARYQGAAPVDFAWQILDRRGERLLRDGRLITDPAENRAELADRWRRFERERLPILRALGVA